MTIPPTRVFSHTLRAVLHFLNGASAQELSDASGHHTLDDFVEDIHGTYTPPSNDPGSVRRPVPKPSIASFDSVGKASEEQEMAQVEVRSEAV